MAVYKTEHGWRVEISFKDTTGKYRKKGKRGFKTKKAPLPFSAIISTSINNYGSMLGSRKQQKNHGMQFANTLLMCILRM